MTHTLCKGFKKSTTINRTISVVLFDVLFRYVTYAFVTFKSKYALTVLEVYQKMSLVNALFNDVGMRWMIGAH